MSLSDQSDLKAHRDRETTLKLYGERDRYKEALERIASFDVYSGAWISFLRNIAKDALGLEVSVTPSRAESIGGVVREGEHAWRWDGPGSWVHVYGGDGLRITLSDPTVELPAHAALSLEDWLKRRTRRPR